MVPTHTQTSKGKNEEPTLTPSPGCNEGPQHFRPHGVREAQVRTWGLDATRG